jgi:hypothetical protein
MFLIICERPLAFYQSLHHCNYEIFQHMTLVRSTEAKLFLLLFGSHRPSEQIGARGIQAP